MIGLFLLAANFLPAGEQIAPPLRDEPPWELPATRRLAADDIASVRLPVALRGYRFAETDLLLDRLGEELRARDEELARLRRGAPVEDQAEIRPRHAEPAQGEDADEPLPAQTGDADEPLPARTDGADER